MAKRSTRRVTIYINGKEVCLMESAQKQLEYYTKSDLNEPIIHKKTVFLHRLTK